jgi:hypothetical protein
MSSFIAFKNWLYESQSFMVDGFNVPIHIVKKEDWAEGKTDPTEFSADEDTVRIRDDYDYKKDPIGWMRHEMMHYKLHHTNGWEDDGKEYPYNSTEEKAYTHQFKYLKKKGYKNYKDVPGFDKSDEYDGILNKYWANA